MNFSDKPILACPVHVQPNEHKQSPRFRLPAEQQGRWVLKTFDLFEVCKLCFKSSCSLNNLLKANGFDVCKSSSGSQAVKWAKEGKLKQLEEYCLQDAKLTYEISAALRARLPLSGWSNSPLVVCTRQGDSSSISFECGVQ